MIEFGTSNPNVWVCIEGVQKEEVYTSVNYVQVSTEIKKSRKNEVIPEYKYFFIIFNLINHTYRY